MKLRENVPRYNIEIHGNLYVDPEALIVMCPECASIDLSKREGTSIFKCNDCGCTFEPWIGSQLTKTGKAVHYILSVLVLIFCALFFITLFGGLIWYEIKKRQLGEDVAKDIYQTKATLISALGPIISLALAAVCAHIDNDYL